ncbi:MAG: hypothetical protein DGJ47_000082 [Rickettsiaceae bacterium]
MIIIISAPSGCGKSSITKRLTEIDSNFVLSISATTRSKRSSEEEGVDYFFIKTPEEFKKINLLESAEIYGNLYGTPKQYIDNQLKDQKNILFDIDWQGARQIIESSEKSKVISFFSITT